MKRGPFLGLVGGAIALAAAFAVAAYCLPFHISSPPPPWPWFCSEPAYPLIGYLTFPVNLLTSDLSRAVLFAPLSLAIYTAVGALIGSRKG